MPIIDSLIGDDPQIEIVHTISFDWKSALKLILAIAIASYITKKF